MIGCDRSGVVLRARGLEFYGWSEFPALLRMDQVLSHTLLKNEFRSFMTPL